MVKPLESNKRVFWEALLLTLVVFVLGLLIGISFESGKVNQVKDYYSYSEANLMDSLAIGSLLDLNKGTCEDFTKANFDFADRIYGEAITLEKYESAGKLTQSLQLEHRKYDLLRTFLWINDMKTWKLCTPDYHSVIYLYEYQPMDLTKRAVQSTWSKVLQDLKNAKGSKVLLVPIAVDTNVTSLDIMIEQFNITKYPALVIDNKDVIYNLTSAGDLEKYFN